MYGRIFSVDGQQGVPLLESKGIFWEKYKPCLTGRWVDTVQAHALNPEAYLKNGFGVERNVVIQADGSVWLNTLNSDTGRYDWQMVDDIYQYKSQQPIPRMLRTVRPVIKDRMPSIAQMRARIRTIERAKE